MVLLFIVPCGFQPFSENDRSALLAFANTAISLIGLLEGGIASKVKIKVEIDMIRS
jgi:hypothetical protein